MEPEQNNNDLHLNGMEVIVPVEDGDDLLVRTPSKKKPQATPVQNDDDLLLLRSPLKKKPKGANVPSKTKIYFGSFLLAYF